MASYNGEVFYRGMTEADWKRLHSRVIPNPVPIEEFKDVVKTGRLQERYLAKDLHKMMQELRDLLREHGEMREASAFPLSGKKHELSRAAAAAVRVIESHRDHIPQLRRSPGASLAAMDAPAARDGSTSPTLDSGSDQQRLSLSDPPASGPSAGLGGAAAARSRRSSRVLPLVDHIAEAEREQQLVTSAASGRDDGSRARQPAVSRDRSAERAPRDGPKSRHAASWTTNNVLSSTIAHHAAVIPPPPSSAYTSAAAAAAPATAAPLRPCATDGPAVGSSLAHEAAPPPTVAIGSAKELAQLNESSPPFFRILNVVRRFQLRFGSSPLRFEIPVQYAEAVSNRRLRVYLIPLRHPNIPARWPTAKEVVVYVNEQCVMTPWKRSWPERKQEVAKTYLPLDVTYLLSRNMASQRMQVDVFNKEYLSPAVIAVVQPQTLEEVTESVLMARVGCRSVAQVQQAFAALQRAADESATASLALLSSNNAAIQKTYAAIMDEDEDEDGLEVDDPVITSKCPISQLPLAVPVRGARCTHLQCVDLDSYLVSSHKGAYWNCALCDAEMRPREVQVDTVLWSFLHSCGGPDGYPTYLRLSARPPGAAAEGRYYWHPSSRTGDDADVISDGDDDGDEEGEEEDEDGDEEHGSPGCGEAREGRGGAAPASLRHVLQTSPYGVASAPTWTAASVASATACAGGFAGPTVERKRGREDSAGEPSGTADDPIEL